MKENNNEENKNEENNNENLNEINIRHSSSNKNIVQNQEKKIYNNKKCITEISINNIGNNNINSTYISESLQNINKTSNENLLVSNIQKRNNKIIKNSIEQNNINSKKNKNNSRYSNDDKSIGTIKDEYDDILNSNDDLLEKKNHINKVKTSKQVVFINKEKSKDNYDKESINDSDISEKISEEQIIIEINNKKTKNKNNILISNISTNNSMTKNSLENPFISEKIKGKENKIIDIFYRRDKVFAAEFSRFNFTYKTTVEYKINNKFKEVRLILYNKNLFLLKVKKKKKGELSNNEVLFLNPEIPLMKALQKEESTSLNELKYEFNLNCPLLSLNFDLLTVKILMKKKDNIVIILVLGSEKVHEIKFKEKAIFEKFSFLIMSAVYRSEGYVNNWVGISLIHSFSSLLFISPSSFENRARTGDILLFRSRQCMSKVQRFYTRDDYDHIILIKRHGGLLAFYEATSLGKVSMGFWENFKFNLMNLAFEKVVYRQLNLEFPEEEIKKITEKINVECQNFVEKTKGMAYFVSIVDILCSKGPKDYQLKKDWKKSKGFSCSSLTAAAYYQMGIIKLVKDVHSVLPGDFAANRNRLSFNKGFSLGPEMILDFTSNG